MFLDCSCLFIYLFFGNSVAEYISQRQPLGGLLFLLPWMFSFENKDDIGSNHQDHASEQIKNLLAELEQLLLHSNIPVSETNSTSPKLSTYMT